MSPNKRYPCPDDEHVIWEDCKYKIFIFSDDSQWFTLKQTLTSSTNESFSPEIKSFSKKLKRLHWKDIELYTFDSGERASNKPEGKPSYWFITVREIVSSELKTTRNHRSWRPNIWQAFFRNGNLFTNTFTNDVLYGALSCACACPMWSKIFL